MVTPCVGVWIEDDRLRILKDEKEVTPCVGVWIEERNPANSPTRK